MADERSNEQHPAMSAEQKAILKKVAKLIPEAKVFEPRAKGTYYGPVVYADKKHVTQQVGDNTVVAHPRKDMAIAEGQAVTAGTVVNVKYDGNAQAPTLEGADPERWKERTAREPASPELTAAAREVLGENFGVYNPPSPQHGLSPRYEGVVAVATDTHLIQRINSRTAIAHDVGPEVAKQYGAGQEVAFTYDNGKLRSVQGIENAKSQENAAARWPRQDRAEEAPRDADDRARAKSWMLAKNLVAMSHGPDAKIYSAARLDPNGGKFRGPIVAITEHHAMQRVGKGNTVVAHNKASLSGEQLQVGRFMQVNYENGKAQVHAAQSRQQAQEQQRAAPERPAPNRSQGISR